MKVAYGSLNRSARVEAPSRTLAPPYRMNGNLGHDPRSMRSPEIRANAPKRKMPTAVAATAANGVPNTSHAGDAGKSHQRRNGNPAAIKTTPAAANAGEIRASAAVARRRAPR